MLSAAATCVTIGLPCVKKGGGQSPLNYRVVQMKTTTHTHENLVTDLMLTEPNE
jgi:hypothetical protein